VKDELQTIMILQKNSSAKDMFDVQMRLIHIIWSIISPVLEKEKLFAKWIRPDFADYETASYEIVDRALQYIMKNKMYNPTISDIANYCHISARQLSRVFTKKVNTTIHEFVQRERFLWACNELVTTTKSIDEISYNLNLNSKQYFCHWFKSHSSKSPSIYRHENKHK